MHQRLPVQNSTKRASFPMCNSNASASTSAKLNQACQLTKLKQTKEQERYPNRFWGLCEKLLPGWQAKQSEILILTQDIRQLEDLTVHADGSVTKDQPGWGFHCQAKCNHHSQRQCSSYSLNLQLDHGDGSSHPCPPLDWLKVVTGNTCHHPHRFKRKRPHRQACGQCHQHEWLSSEDQKCWGAWDTTRRYKAITPMTTSWREV